jgi:RimJ/RimL family protein N-acetyltransferase
MKIEPQILSGRFVRLEPLEPRHLPELKRACEADTEIWPLYPFSMAGEHFDVWVAMVEKRTARGEALAFAVMKDDRVVGTSLFIGIDPANRNVEIGNTYYHPDFRGTAINPESKLLMMAHAFGSGAQCVRFRVDALNARSRAAVLKLGAKQEGIMRRDRITWTGRFRDTVLFSVLDDEWTEVRENLEARLARF